MMEIASQKHVKYVTDIKYQNLQLYQNLKKLIEIQGIFERISVLFSFDFSWHVTHMAHDSNEKKNLFKRSEIKSTFKNHVENHGQNYIFQQQLDLKI